MKKSSKLLLVLSLLGLGSGVLASCSTNASNVIIPGKINEGTETAASYNIVNASSEIAYLDGLPEKGVAHQSYSFRVSLKPGYHFNDKLSITSGETNVAYTLKDSYYTFEMPEADVAITLDTGRTDFTIKSTSGFVSTVYLDKEKAEGEEDVVARSALPGTLLKFKAVSNEDFTFTTITMNGKALAVGEDEFYHFTMPTRPAIISSDKVAVKYDVTMASELALSTAIVYTNAETKAPITQAVKGDKVYIAFTPKAENASIKYTVTVSTIAGESEKSKTLAVSPVGDATNLFSFDMISKNVEITVKEVDLSLYQRSALINKAWKGINISDENKFGTASYVKELSKTISFNDDGTGSMKNFSSESSIAWEPSGTTDATVLTPSSSGKTITTTAVSTDHIMAMQYPTTIHDNASWDDAIYYLADNTYVLHYYGFNKTNHDRLVWIEDANHNILENIFVHDDTVRKNVIIKTLSGATALGNDITENSFFSIYDGETKIVDIAGGTIAVQNNITTVLADHTACEIKDSSGNTIISSYNGLIVSVNVSLTSDAPENLGVSRIEVKDADDNKVAVTQLSDTSFTFVMPEKAVTITTKTADASKYKGYSVLGNYLAIDYDNYCDDDFDFSQKMPRTWRWNVSQTGEVYKDDTLYTIDSLENVADGEMVLTDTTAYIEKHVTVKFSNGVLVTPYSSSWSDSLVGIRLPVGKTEQDVKVQGHHISTSYSNSIWAFSYLVDNEVFGSVFNYKGEVFAGVTFTFDEGSTRIGADSSYHVVKNGVTLFDVINGTVTDKRSAS